jgi:hypothetical protein
MDNQMRNRIALGTVLAIIVGVGLIVGKLHLDSSGSPSDQFSAQKSQYVTDISLVVDGMGSSAAKQKAEKLLTVLSGVLFCEGNALSKRIDCRYDPEKISVQEMMQALNTNGFKASIPGADGKLQVIDYSIQFH